MLLGDAAMPCDPAIANALFDAAGVRFSKPPFTPETVRETLEASLNHPMEAIG